MATNPAVIPKPDDYNEPFGADNGHRLVIAASVGVGLSTIWAGLRIWTRRYVSQALGVDDYLMAAAWFTAIVLTAGVIVQERYGTGTHLWELPGNTFEIFLKLQMVVGTFYAVSLPLTKCSILAFYLRLSQEKIFRILVFATLVFVAGYSISGIFVIIFSCIPVAGSWDLALAALPTTRCVNRPVGYLSQAAFNIASDLFILALPIPTIWKLQMRLQQRLYVIAIFACGFFVCIVSIIRLSSIIALLNSADVTWLTTDVLMWSTIETHVAIICACSPHLKPLLGHFFPSVFHSRHVQQKYPKYPDEYGARRYGHGRSNERGLQQSRSKSRSRPDDFEMYGVRGSTTTMVEHDLRETENNSQENILDSASKDAYATRTVGIT